MTDPGFVRANGLYYYRRIVYDLRCSIKDKESDDAEKNIHLFPPALIAAWAAARRAIGTRNGEQLT